MDEFKKYYDHALKFLSYRPRSEKEVRYNLIKRIFRTRHSGKRSASGINTVKDSGFAEAHQNDDKIIDQVIAKLKEQNFINDEEFTRWWIEQRTKFRPRGLRLIKIELKRKGISDKIINNILDNSEFKIQNDTERIKKLVEKRLPKYKGLEKREIYQKLVQFLASRGFDYDTIKEAVDDVLKKGV